MSYDDSHSAETFIADHHRPELVSTDPGLPMPSGVAIGAMAGLTAAELALIVTGSGWWVLPVSVFVAAFCVMFLGLMWMQCCEIMRIFAKVMGPPPPRRPRKRKRPEPPIVLIHRATRPPPPPNPPRPTTTPGPPDFDG